MSLPAPSPDWEAFYRDYRKPGYVPGFEITTKLGGGTFGLVFRARRLSIGKDYAIKFLHVEDGVVQQAVMAELEQVKWFAQIDHPNLVSIEDRGEVDGIPYLVMAFAGTETLRDRMVAGQVPSGEGKDELLRLFLQSCRGLSALHERSLVHFDIKPANVFLKGSVARLGDYGLSKLVTHSRGSLSMGRGTPYYMAPELLQRRGDHRSDVYSLGVMLYELLCAALPFTGDNEWEVLKKHETEPPALPPHLSARERTILTRCLAKDPAARFQSVADLIAAFGAPAGVGAAGASAAALVPMAALPPAPALATAAGERRVEPPPLPANLPDERPAPPPRRRAIVPPPPPVGVFRRAIPIAVAVGLALFLFSMRGSRSRPQFDFPDVQVVDASASPPPAAPDRPSPRGSNGRRRSGATTTSSATPFEQQVQNVAKNARTAAQRERRTDLRPLDLARLGADRDVTACATLVRQFARSPQFSAPLADRLEQLGRPAFLASLGYLRELDYEDAGDCRAATHVLNLLGQFVGTDALDVEMAGSEPCTADTCRYEASVDGWFRLAQQYAADDAAFAALRAERGKAGSQR
jgi:hypothetical protein